METIKTLTQPGERLFTQLITNSEQLTELTGEISETNEVTMLAIRAYLKTVLEGEKGRSHCPFVQMVEQQNGYYVLNPHIPHNPIDYKKTMDIVASKLERVFKKISPRPTYFYQPTDPTTVVSAFKHPETYKQEFGEFLEKFRNEKRQYFLDKGLMLAHMHPLHKLGSSTNKGEKSEKSLYNSGIPLLMVRRMHAPDHVFMHTEEEKRAYDNFFGPEVRTEAMINSMLTSPGPFF